MQVINIWQVILLTIVSNERHFLAFHNMKYLDLIDIFNLWYCDTLPSEHKTLTKCENYIGPTWQTVVAQTTVYFKSKISLCLVFAG